MDQTTTLVSGNDFNEFSQSLTKAIQSLPCDQSRRLHQIRLTYIAKFGFSGTYERLNGRTVAEILAVCQPAEVTPIDSGEIDGVKWALYRPPSENVDAAKEN